MREGAVELLAKPLDHQLLRETVRAALDFERHGYNNRIV